MTESQDHPDGGQFNDGADLLARVIDACQAGISKALSEPRTALEFAASLQSTLATLTSVAGAVKDPTANPSLTAFGPRIVAEALSNVIAAADTVSQRVSEPDAAGMIASLTPDAPPREATTNEATAAKPVEAKVKETAPPKRTATMPRAVGNEGDKITFSKVAKLYIATQKQAGASKGDIGALELKARTFVEVLGDRPINTYFPIDLQTYVNEMQHWVLNASQRREFKGLSVREILKRNKDFKYQPISKKTLQDGYVAHIRAMINFGAQVHRFTNPFAGCNIRYPKMLKASVSREALSAQTLSSIFAKGVAEGHLDSAMLPLLGLLTSRRLALLVYLRGSDIRRKDGVWIAQVGNIVEVDGIWQRVPNKTDASLSYFVLHSFLEEIGFIDWAVQRPGWTFEEAHEHPDPGDYESKVTSRLFKSSGALGANKEVFHSLRHMAIDANRDTDTRTRDQKLQSGHALGTDEHENYGSRTIKDKAAQKIRDASLPDEIDFSVFQNLDFDALAKPRRSRQGARRRRVIK